MIDVATNALTTVSNPNGGTTQISLDPAANTAYALDAGGNGVTVIAGASPQQSARLRDGSDFRESDVASAESDDTHSEDVLGHRHWHLGGIQHSTQLTVSVQ